MTYELKTIRDFKGISKNLGIDTDNISDQDIMLNLYKYLYKNNELSKKQILDYFNFKDQIDIQILKQLDNAVGTKDENYELPKYIFKKKKNQEFNPLAKKEIPKEFSDPISKIKNEIGAIKKPTSDELSEKIQKKSEEIKADNTFSEEDQKKVEEIKNNMSPLEKEMSNLLGSDDKELYDKIHIDNTLNSNKKEEIVVEDENQYNNTEYYQDPNVDDVTEKKLRKAHTNRNLIILGCLLVAVIFLYNFI